MRKKWIVIKGRKERGGREGGREGRRGGKKER